MLRSLNIVCTIGCAITFCVLDASPIAAQAATGQSGDVLARMRTDLSAKRYASVIAEANALLESARTITTPERVELWQLLAAAYYPEAPSAQKPDSAVLPLEALIRLEPDITIARNLTWTGLDALLERTRAQTFAVTSRPLAEYSLTSAAAGALTVVASRPSRFRLSSVDDAGERSVVHDSSAYGTAAALQLRTHDARGPIFTDGAHQLHLWAYDSISGDSLLIAHRVLAQRNDLSTPDAAPPVTPRVLVPAQVLTDRTAPVVASKQRATMLWGGLALAAATAAFAQEARPKDALQSAFRVDARAFAVSGAMAAAAIANFFVRRAPSQPYVQPTVGSPTPPTLPDPMATYRVRLLIDPPER